MSTTIHKQLLVGLDNLFSGPDKWIRNYLHNKDHTAWCLLGGIYKVAETMGVKQYATAVNTAWERIDEIAIARSKAPKYSAGYAPTEATSYNNHPATSFEDIKSLIREAIEAIDA